MKKTVIVLLALIFAAPAMADDVVFDINDVGCGIIAIDYNATAAPNDVSAFALKVSVDAGKILAVTDYHVGESNSTAKGYGIFPCNIDINESTGNVDAYGSPVAPNTATGAAGTGIDTNSVILELGALYEDGNAPPRTGTLCKVEVSEVCTMTVAADATRGNVVLDTAEEATTNLPESEADVGCNICDTYGWLRFNSDNAGFNYGPQDGKVDFWDIQVVLYFYDNYVYPPNDPNCWGLYPADPNLCVRADNCGFNYSQPDGVIDFWDIQAVLYFYDQNVCQ
jgi:hypothetical protein